MKIDWGSRRVAISTIIVVGLIVFFITLFNGFVIDDLEIIVGSPLVHSVSNLPKFFQGGAFQRGGGFILLGQYYRPLMLTFFSTLYTLFGEHAFYFHLFQVLLFILDTILIYLLLNEFFKPTISLVLSLIYLVHPMNLLPAIFISSAGDTLFMAFGLSAVLLLRKTKELKLPKLVLLALFLLLSILSKESGVLFFMLVLLIAFMYQKKNFWKIILVLTTSSSIYLYLRFFVAKNGVFLKNFAPIQRASTLDKLISLPKIMSYYFESLILPVNLSMFQHWVVRSVDFVNFVFPLLILAFVFGLFLYFEKALNKKGRSKTFHFFLTWFLLGAILLLPFFPLDMTVSDRWFFFPMVGFLGMAGAVWEAFSIKPRKVIVITILFVIIALATRSITRIMDWKSNFTLGRADVRYNADSFETQGLYGIEVAYTGDLKTGEDHLQKSVAIYPYWVNLTNLASVYLAEGKMDLALTTFERAGQFHYYKAYEDIAGILLFHKSANEAVNRTKSFLRYYPTDPKLWYILSLAELKTGNRQEALTAAKKYGLLVGMQNLFNLINSGATFDQIVSLQKSN